jgi:hypothetical protein
MIKFFRKIRYDLMEKNKTGKYFKYAIGEIVLVVIGILIALSINNWNEVRKDKIKSYSYLQRLNEDIEIISVDVDNSIKGTENNLKNSILVKDALISGKLPIEKQPNFDKYLYQYHQFYITIKDANTYNEMLNAGELNLIENRWIRDAFSDFSSYRDFIIEVNRTYHEDAIQKINTFEKYIRYELKNPATDSSKTIPIYDFKAISTDTSLINWISRQSHTWDGISRMFRSYNDDVIQIRDSIQNELKKFN